MTGASKRLRGLWVVAGLMLGAALFAVSMLQREPPAHASDQAQPPVVRVIEVQPLAVRLEARGHGVSRAATTWRAVANVSGRVVQRHPELESGTLLPAGTLLLELDTSRYRLAVAAAEADLAALAAEQAQLEAETGNTGRLLELERERLELAERELRRIDGLAQSGAVSQTQRDEQRRATLAQRQAVQTLENQLRLLPSRRQRLAAEVERAETRRDQARQDLADTRFVAPYDLRLGRVDAELHQHIAVGQLLFEADGIAAAEVEVQVPFDQLLRLLGAVARPGTDDAARGLAERVDLATIQAEVQLVGAAEVTWQARLSRIASGLDPATRTARVVLTVDAPYRDAAPPARPALQRDMYLRARLSAPSAAPLIVIPRATIHQGEVYLADPAGRLERRAVELAFEQSDLAVVGAGLEPGERLILDDLLPAVSGTVLQPQPDVEAAERLRRLAAGDAR